MTGSDVPRCVMDLDKTAIKDMILAEGIELEGVASAEDLLHAQPARPPCAPMPSARRVIVTAVGHSLGAVYASDIRPRA